MLTKRTDDEKDHIRKVKNEFLIQLDGLGTQMDEWVFLIGATNRPYDLDNAILRRFVASCYIAKENPDRRTRKARNHRYPEEVPRSSCQ